MYQLMGELRAVVSTAQSTPAQIETGNVTRTQGAVDLPAARSRRQRRPAITCYGCGGQGHYRRQCPSRQGNRPVELVSPGTTVAANRHIKGQSGLYLRMKIGKKWCLALVDTGSEITLVPRSLVEGAVLEASNQRLQAANRTEITVKGETRISIVIIINNNNNNNNNDNLNTPGSRTVSSCEQYGTNLRRGLTLGHSGQR